MSCSQKIPAFFETGRKCVSPKKSIIAVGGHQVQRIGDPQLEELVVRVKFLEGSRQSSLYLNQWNMVSQL